MAENTQTEDITLDHVLNTGANADRTPIETPETKDKDKDKDKSTSPDNSSTPDGDNSKDTPKTTINTEENKDKFKTLITSLKNVEGLSEDKVSIRAQLLSKYTGENFDDEGNIIDKDGNIVKSFEDIITDLDKEETVTLDAKGNQIDKDGNILKTKAEIAAENSIVNKMHASSEYEFLDDNGETKVYSDDEKGLNEFTNDVAEQKFNEYRDRFIAQNPVLIEVAKHLLTGNDLSTFNQSVDYSKIDKKTLSDDEKLAYIKKSFEVKQLPKTQIDNLLTLIKDGNTIDKDFDIALTSLTEADKAQKDARDAAYQASVKADQEAVEAHWNKVNDIIINNKTELVKIPKADQKEFFDYMATAVNDKGQSQAMVDASKESLERQVELAYLRFKGFNFDSIVNQKVNQKRVESLKDLMTRSANIKETPINDGNSTQTSGDIDVNISTLLGN